MNQHGSTRILIAERHAAVRLAIKMFVEKQPGLEIVGEAGDAQELLALMARTHPDVVLLDLDLSDQPPTELVQALRQINSQSTLIALDVQPETAKAALAAGADDFVSKSDPPTVLLNAIQAAQGVGRKPQPPVGEP